MLIGKDLEYLRG